MEQRQRILVIDGNAEHRAILRSRLEAEGFAVNAVGSGPEGHAALAGPVDLALLDMALPIPEGVESYQALRANPRTRRTPVILLTEYATGEHWESVPSDTDGPCFVAAKSGDGSLLLARITQLLAQAIAEI